MQVVAEIDDDLDGALWATGLGAGMTGLGDTRRRLEPCAKRLHEIFDERIGGFRIHGCLQIRSQNPGAMGADPQGLIAVLIALEAEPEQTRAVQQRVGVEHQLLDLHDDLDGLAGIARIGSGFGGFGDLYGLIQLLTERLEEVSDNGVGDLGRHMCLLKRRLQTRSQRHGSRAEAQQSCG